MNMKNRLWLTVASISALTVSGTALAGGCTADIDENGSVGATDLLALLAEWGPCPGCAADLDGDDNVGTPDLLLLLAEWGAECGSFTATELAGEPLGQYPHFQYVTAFNEGENAHIAIDPSRYPDIAGQTCDVYIVAGKTTGQWDADNTLTDVRGGAQTEVFTGVDIQSNTRILTNSATLSGEAGTGLGVAFDVVCDCNQDGLLNAGDYIDGYNETVAGRRPVHGMYIVHDTTDQGPYSVTELTYNVPGWTGASGYAGHNTFYPSNIATLGELPLIVISRGNGHNHVWYDHIGVHMASYGYVVMSHNNHTEPGIETASTTTLLHTDTFIEQLPNIGGGAMVDHIDTSRIVWIGHSRGGEGVTRAYDRLFDGGYTPENYSIDDIHLISSMAPTDFLGTASSNVHGANYHLWTGAADSDVWGCASCNLCQTYHLHDRAEGYRQSTTLQGCGHAWFHNGGGTSWAEGPALIGEADTHLIQLGYLLPLVKHYIEGNVPAKDFLWRQYESFHPIGAPTGSDIHVDLIYREDPAEASFIVDDFQSGPGTGVSSSGGTVTFSVTNLYEGDLDDENSDFTANASDEPNGMIHGGPSDLTKGVIFDWSNSNRFFEQGIVVSERDFTDDTWLSFRGAQATRHSNTTAVLGDLTFNVSLRDGDGTTSTLNIGAYGGGLEEPYQRTGCGSGTGWSAEFETIRMRVTDFAHNNADLDLSNIVAIRFDFGPSHGDARGRIALDEIYLSNDASPAVPGALTMTAVSSIPTLIGPGESTGFLISISGASDTVVPGSPTLHYRFDGGSYIEVPMDDAGGGLYTVNMPGPSCGDMPEFYFTAEGESSGTLTLPALAPTEVFGAEVGTLVAVFEDDFETVTGWTEINLGASSGDWQRGVPVNDPGWAYDPASDSDGSGSAYLTQNELGNTDVDNGAVRLISPVFDGTANGLQISYDYYLFLTDSDGNDALIVEVSTNGTTWTEVTRHDQDNGLDWASHTITSADLADAGIVPTATMQVRFTVNDADTQSIVEAGLDAFSVAGVNCE